MIAPTRYLQERGLRAAAGRLCRQLSRLAGPSSGRARAGEGHHGMLFVHPLLVLLACPLVQLFNFLPARPQVNTHGSGNTYAYFLPPGSALIEIVPWNLHSLEWPSPCPDFVDYYFKDVFHKDLTVRTGYLRCGRRRLPGWRCSLAASR